MISKLKSVIYLFISLLLIVYVISFLVNQIPSINMKWNQTSNSFNEIFLFFASTSLILFIVHCLVYKKNKGQLGFVFLVTLTLKVAASFFFINKIVYSFEKYYSFIYFFIFLVIDVFLTVRLLNRKD